MVQWPLPHGQLFTKASPLFPRAPTTEPLTIDHEVGAGRLGPVAEVEGQRPQGVSLTELSGVYSNQEPQKYWQKHFFHNIFFGVHKLSKKNNKSPPSLFLCQKEGLVYSQHQGQFTVFTDHGKPGRLFVEVSLVIIVAEESLWLSNFWSYCWWKKNCTTVWMYPKPWK